MKIVDIHTHIYNAAESRALKMRFGARADDLGRKFRDRDLSITGLNEAMRASGVVRSLVLPVVTPSASPEQTTIRVWSKLDEVRSIVSENRDLSAFGAIHPDMKMNEIGDAVALIDSWGWRGIKLHSPQQKFDPASDTMDDIFGLLEETGVGVLMDTFYDKEYFDALRVPKDFALDPRKLRQISRQHPRITIIAAHMAGLNWWGIENILREVKPTDSLFLDTSSSHKITREEMRRFVNRFGIDHIIFGSDHPYHDMALEIQRIKGLGLTDSELEAVMYLNAERLLG